MTREESERKNLVYGTATALVVGFGLFINEYVVAFAFSPDATLSTATKWQVRGLMAGLIAGGVVLYRCRDRLDRFAMRALKLHPNGSALVMGSVAALLGVILIETTFYSLDTIRSRRSGWVAQAPELLPGTNNARASLSVRGQTVYDVTYTIDEQYARRTADVATTEAEHDLFFFGGSFVFGEGVEDDETLPSVVARLAPDWRVTNFGFPGHGPSQMLKRLESDAPLRDSVRDDVTLVYVFIPGHVRRVIGSMRVATSWGRNFPSYALDADAEPRLSGTFSDSRPILSRAYALFSRERILKYYGVDIPLRIRAQHLQLTARVIAAARDRLLERYGSDEFYVVLYPSNPRDEFSAKDFIPSLDVADLSYFDYTDLFDDDGAYRLPHDDHPTPLAHEKVGTRLARDLGLGTL